MKGLDLLRAVALPIAALSAAALSGCGATAETLCEEYCNCEGCAASGDDSQEDCVDEVIAYEGFASDLDCDAEFSTWFDCLDAEATCEGDHFETDMCDPQEDELQRCTRDNF